MENTHFGKLFEKASIFEVVYLFKKLILISIKLIIIIEIELEHTIQKYNILYYNNDQRQDRLLQHI